MVSIEIFLIKRTHSIPTIKGLIPFSRDKSRVKNFHSSTQISSELIEKKILHSETYAWSYVKDENKSTTNFLVLKASFLIHEVNFLKIWKDKILKYTDLFVCLIFRNNMYLCVIHLHQLVCVRVCDM